MFGVYGTDFGQFIKLGCLAEYNMSNITTNFTGTAKGSSDFIFSKVADRIFVAFLALAVVVGVAGNIMVILGISYAKRLHKPVYIILCQVAASDALLMIIVAPLNIYSLANFGWESGHILCYMQAFLAMEFKCASGLLLLILAVYRLSRVCYENIYKRISRTAVVTILSVIAWTEPVILFAWLGENAVNIKEYLQCHFNGNYLMPVLLVVIYVPCVFVPTALYLRIACYIRMGRTRVNPTVTVNTDNQANMVFFRTSQLTKTTVLIFLNYVLTAMIPGAIQGVALLPDDLLKRRALCIALVLGRLTPSLDFMIYFLASRDIRIAVNEVCVSARLMLFRDKSDR
ncbi:hypothetical protein CHS0354_039289 [Potamilus streckersoni]|uniref:G-protein coupled receptors family 1 profile domain-containing protein n=1 Tax=Potamilus streckersoni TaxID=2493646 RepID=A0AAE0RMU3_9BIVA|nr:hypothetical protein CHS0354_039289 [Potamilus streckersoni]